MNHNPYSSSNVANDSLAFNPTAPVLAQRWKRFIAYLIDMVINAAICLAINYISPGIFDSTKVVQGLIAFAISVAIWGIVNYWFLLRGQTIGKMAVGIVVVDHGGSPIVNVLFLCIRYGLPLLPGYVNEWLMLLSLIDGLFVFGKKKRTLHDYIFSTNVYNKNVDSKESSNESLHRTGN